MKIFWPIGAFPSAAIANEALHVEHGVKMTPD